MVLGDCSNHKNLITTPFTLGNDLEVLILLEEGHYDISTMFAEELKIFYNQPNNVWRMFLDINKVKKNLKFKEHMELDDGEEYPIFVPMHLDAFYLSIYIIKPAIYYSSAKTKWREQKLSISYEELKKLREKNYREVEEFMIRKVEGAKK